MKEPDLTPIQIEAINHIIKSFSVNVNPICSLGQGLGKTRVACKIIQSLYYAKNLPYKIIIIHRASNYEDPWINELSTYNLINKIELNTNTNIVSGYIYLHGKERKKAKLGDKYYFPSRIITLTSYDTLRMDIENNSYDLSQTFDLAIIDEIQTINNCKRLTQKLKSISYVKADRKIVLTASPIQNDVNEIGVIYAFLNDNSGFQKLVNLFSKLDDESNIKNKRMEINSILKSYCDDCLKKYALFYYAEKNKYRKVGRILSLPIDDLMFDQSKEISTKLIPKQRMFLSHPSSVYKNEDISTLPRSTKADAVKIILESMICNEKAVIFSLYIDVITVYAELCKKWGYSVIIITGRDRGRILRGKLIAFENITEKCILLTTLQKSAEGLNFYFATHVIILEFWWNPQKIIQAMSRIDRIKQVNNIFIYLLCYNYNNKMIKQERIIYKKMCRKITKANNYLLENLLLHPIDIPDSKIIFKKMPKMIVFNDINAFEIKLIEFIKYFIHSDIKSKPIYERPVDSFTNVREKIYKRSIDILNVNSILKNYPWLMGSKMIMSQLTYRLNVILSGEYGSLLRQSIETDDGEYSAKSNTDMKYEVVFIDNYVFNLNTFYNKQILLSIIYVIGKRKGGKIDLLDVHYRNRRNNYDSIFKKLKERNIKSINFIVSNRDNLKNIKKSCANKYKRTKFQYCLLDIFKRITQRIEIDKAETDEISSILSANTFLRAVNKIKEARKRNVVNIVMLRRLGLIFKMRGINEIFTIKMKNRNIFCTNNIIFSIAAIVQLLLLKKEYYNIMDALAFIKMASFSILKYGKHFIPNWDVLTKKIDK
jgi:superfamily II DNA or RNA helicase